MATFIDWPEDIIPNSGSFFYRGNQTRFRSPFTGVQQILNRQGARWVGEWNFRVLEEKSKELDALLIESQWGSIPFKVWDFRNEDHTGTGKTVAEWYNEIKDKTASLSISGSTTWQSWYDNTYSPTVPEPFSIDGGFNDGTGFDTSSDCPTPEVPATYPWGRLNTVQEGSQTFYICGFEPGSTIATDGTTITIAGTNYTVSGTLTASNIDGSALVTIQETDGLEAGVITDNDGNNFSSSIDLIDGSTWSGTKDSKLVSFSNWAPNQTIFRKGGYLGRYSDSDGVPRLYILIDDVTTDDTGSVSNITVERAINETFSNEVPTTKKVPLLMKVSSVEDSKNNTSLPYTAEYKITLEEDLTV